MIHTPHIFIHMLALPCFLFPSSLPFVSTMYPLFIKVYLSWSSGIKPWPNGLTSRCKFWTCVSFGHPLALTCDNLRGLALTLVELKLDTSRCKFWSQVICYKNTLTNDTREICSFLRLVSRLVNPFGHPSQVRTQILVLQTCVDLWVPLARA